VEIVAALNAIVAVELRWGFWKCFDRLRHLGYAWNHKRVHRVYCRMRLNQVRRTKRRLPRRERIPLVIEPIVNAGWALDAPVQRIPSTRRAGRPAASALSRDVARAIVYFRTVYLTGKLTTSPDVSRKNGARHFIAGRRGCAG
jgi:hypothetical protein